ncbi:uncharacterized protein [Montipora foliosa]|uniref:uncharacterized protein n=1 Tax=Montipora foliosa TaxID=591990 RepID=UPI0035F2075E
MPKHRTKRRPKRRFLGNQFSKPATAIAIKSDTNEDNQPKEEACGLGSPDSSEAIKKSVSSKKLLTKGDLIEEKPFTQEPTITGFRFVDMEILSSAFSAMRCADCGDFGLVLSEKYCQRKGCASSLRVLCESCGWKHEFCTSKKQTLSYEVNRRLVYSMRFIGKGHSGAKKFCTLMNMPPPPTARAYQKNARTVAKHVKAIAKDSMSNAAKQIRDAQHAGENDVVNCGVSCDGTWQKRGYSSQNGCVIVMSIDSGRVLDAEPLSKVCKQCQRHSHLDKDSEEYRHWRADHNNCKSNYKGSAPAMEAEGADRIFRRSVITHKLRYAELYSDGDSKSFNKVKDVYSADSVQVVKQECIGHVQKRVETALRKLKKENPGLGGKGKLTDAIIDKLQNYYGIAIRSNIGDLSGMKKAVHASFFHCASSEKRDLHNHCPAGPSSWCGFQRDRNTFKHGPGLPDAVIARVKPVYQRLSEDTLLNKCLHGKTQNQNEAVNGMVWERIPKEVFVGMDLLEFGLFDAINHFNIGARAVLLLLEALKIVPGKYTEEGCRGLHTLSHIKKKFKKRT